MLKKYQIFEYIYCMIIINILTTSTIGFQNQLNLNINMIIAGGVLVIAFLLYYLAFGKKVTKH